MQKIHSNPENFAAPAEPSGSRSLVHGEHFMRQMQCSIQSHRSHMYKYKAIHITPLNSSLGLGYDEDIMRPCGFWWLEKTICMLNDMSK